MELNSENQVLISAIIPIAGFPNGHEQILKWTSNPILSKFEIILVIDSESIDLKNQVESIAQNIRNITEALVLHSTSRNPGGSRNLGLVEARGDWIVFWDCDDVPDPSKFVEMVYQAQAQTADVAVGAFSVHSDKATRFYKNEPSKPYEILESIAVNPGIWRFAFRSKFVKNFSFPELRMGEDQMFLFEVLTSTKNILARNINVYEYWLYERGQLTKSKEALKDLRKARQYFEEKFTAMKCHILMIVVIRLNLTSLKKGLIADKLQSLVYLVRLTLSDIRQLPSAIRTLILIWISK